MSARLVRGSRIERAWRVLEGVLDPEVPALSICDLGIVRGVSEQGGELEVVLTPTYSGCPATEAIEADVRSALERRGLGPARIVQRRAPAWTSDWITAQGRRRLLECGIAPPGAAASADGAPVHLVRWAAPALACPHCGSARTQRLSAFGSTACKALYRCLACREPFEHFKPI